MKKRILLTGGGTGGHIYPIIAVAERLKGETCRYFGPNDAWAGVIRETDIPTSAVAHAKLRRYFSLRNFVDAPKFTWSVLQALVKVALFRPHVAFSKGGPGALPVLFACWLYGVPIVIHESDSVPGLTSRVTGKWAHIVELGWGDAARFFPGKKTNTVGVPIRKELLTCRTMTKHAARAVFGMTGDKPILLVIGGSQGSQRMNALILENLPALLEEYQVIHQVGDSNWPEYMTSYATLKQENPGMETSGYKPYAYLDGQMGAAYRAADCAVSRAGSAIFELATFGVPAVLVPLPESAHDHQMANAREYSATGAALTITEKEMTGELLREALCAMTGNETARAAALTFARPDAAEEIARDILSI